MKTDTKTCVRCGGSDAGFSKAGTNRRGEQRWRRECKRCAHEARRNPVHFAETVSGGVGAKVRATQENDDYLHSEYEFLSSWGLSHEQIAVKLEMRPSELGYRVEAWGIGRAFSREGWAVLLKIERDLKRMRFTSSVYYPEYDLETTMLAFKEAIRRGWCRYDGLHMGKVARYKSLILEK